MPPDVRKIALSTLNKLDQGHQTLDRLMEDTFAREDAMQRRDRALLNALVFGTIRWRRRLDWVIGHFSKTPIGKIDRPVLNILRLGMFQITFMDRIPVSAAVNTSSELAKKHGGRWIVGFVNAILRNAARHLDQVPYPDADKDPLAALAVQKAFPDWLLDRWIRRFGVPETTKLCDAINSIPPLSVRANTLKCSRDQLHSALKDDVADQRLLAYAPDGIALTRPKKPLVDLGPFAQGWFQVQDEAAQLVSLLLDPQPGATVLDACAGLGGKTGHLAQLMDNRGKIVAVDHKADKLKHLALEMQRLGISIVEPLTADLSQPVKGLSNALFDGILLDAPCSGLGVMRRNPDIKWVLSKKNLKYYTIRQMKLLESVASMVKPSGALVYAVCSMEPEESESIIATFLSKHPEFRCVTAPGSAYQKVANLIDAQGYFKSFPHRDNMDGFFAARLERIR